MFLILVVHLLLIAAAHAGALSEDFNKDAGAWVGGRIEDGVLVVEDGSAWLQLGELGGVEGTLRLRLASGSSLSLALQGDDGGASWVADYGPGGGLRMGEGSLPMPDGHRVWVPDAEPVITPSAEYWDAANTLHCDVHYDDASSTWFLFWTGEMGGGGYPYRQIGLATSSDGETWTKYAGNPVLTIDYDRTTVDGIHVHMPTVVVNPADATWHMYYSCYQNDQGNRICHATSPDGYTWSPEGVVLDFGGVGEFDEGSLRMPDVVIDDLGTWHMLYNGTDPEEHYGPTGYAISSDGWTWTKEEIVAPDKSTLQGGGMVRSPYGVEQWWNCDDAFCGGLSPVAADGSYDLSTWELFGSWDGGGIELSKGWASWNSGYIQSPSPWLVDTTYHIWFNAYDYAVDDEVITHAWTAPSPGTWTELELSWTAGSLEVQLDGGPSLQAPLGRAERLVLSAVGRAELDELTLRYSLLKTGGGGDGGGGGDAPEPEDDVDSGAEPPAEGCGCGAGDGRGALLLLLLLPIPLSLSWLRRRQ